MSAKAVALTFRGFDVAPRDVEAIIGVAASEMGVRGEAVRPGVATRLKRSFARFSVDLPDNLRFDEMIPVLFERLGGTGHLCDVRDRVNPEFLEVDVILRIKGSDEQEGGFLPPPVLADLFALRATLTFQFI